MCVTYLDWMFVVYMVDTIMSLVVGCMPLRFRRALLHLRLPPHDTGAAPSLLQIPHIIFHYYPLHLPSAVHIVTDLRRSIREPPSSPCHARPLISHCLMVYAGSHLLTATTVQPLLARVMRIRQCVQIGFGDLHRCVQDVAGELESLIARATAVFIVLFCHCLSHLKPEIHMMSTHHQPRIQHGICDLLAHPSCTVLSIDPPVGWVYHHILCCVEIACIQHIAI
ncbi:hypothetical protein JB92DRAFT_1659481 [Gautieria morchelliformis]|nr:hypothetical protein JB92DRAFT_1659481 [Gautieria morchelliformis]